MKKLFYTAVTVFFALKILKLFQMGTFEKHNNACKNFVSYFYMDESEDCFHIDEVYNKNISEVLIKHIGCQETHDVTTEDGYILTLFRLPKTNPKGVILLEHNFISDCSLWLSHSNESIPLFFWKSGYEVWLANNRGTYFSKKHVNLTVSDPKFWDYSVHEIGLYDHSSTITYVKKATNGSKIIFIGYSMSTTTGLIYASLKPEEAKESIDVMILLAPVVFPRNTDFFLKLVARLASPFLKMLSHFLQWNSFLGYDTWYVIIARHFIINFKFKRFGIWLLTLYMGSTADEFDPTYYISSLSHLPSEITSKTLLHYEQIINGNSFQMYDYGQIKNLEIYGTSEPPVYPVGKIKNPIYIIYSTSDVIAHPEDVEFLHKNLPDATKTYGITKIDSFNHIDFFSGKHRKEKVYNRILQSLDNKTIVGA